MKSDSTTQFYTYLHCKPNGDPFYVGKGMCKRATILYCRSAHHKNIVAKYGKENIGIFIFPRLSEKDALDTEIRWIAQFKREGITLCNMTDGGDGLSNPSSETRAKMSAAGKGRIHSPEHRAKLRAATAGQKRQPLSAEHRANIGASHTGKNHSAETLAKMGVAHTGRIHSMETRAKISAANTGRIRSPEHRAKISATKTGRKFPPMSAETRAKISAAKTGRARSPETLSKISATLALTKERKRLAALSRFNEIY